MFKLSGHDDIDLEEDFFQKVFSRRKQENQVTKSIPTTVTQDCGTTRCTAVPNPKPQIRFPLHDLQESPNIETRTTAIRGSINELVSSRCQASSPTEPTIAAPAKPENDFDEFGDIDWDQCFEEDDLNQKQTVVEKPVNNLSGNVSVPNRKEEDDSPKWSPSAHNSPSVINNGRNPSTPTSSTPKQPTSRSVNKSGRKRKFPGPAGLLPTQQNGSFSLHLPMDSLISDDSNEASKLKDINESMLLSQVSENPFESDPWLQMQEDLDLNASDSHILKKYNIAWVLLKATRKQLPNGKVPILILVLKSILEKGTEASVVFKDETGEIPGTIHRKVFEEFEDCLVPGTVLVVRKVSVFSPNSRKHYLSVTPSNMVCLYSPNTHKPKVAMEGVTNLRFQVRQYALETCMTPECDTVQRRIPPLPNLGDRNRLSHAREVTRNETEQATVKPSHSVISNPVIATNVKYEEDEEQFIQDDELDKFLEDLENDFD